MTSVTYALGALVRPGARALRLGAEHPSQAGLVEIVVTEADGIVIDAEVRRRDDTSRRAGLCCGPTIP